MSASDTGSEGFLARIPSARRRRDAERMLELMARATGQPARFQGKAVGYGTYHYHYESGRQGDAAAAGFAARAEATVVYLPDGVDAHADELERLGPHRAGVGCLYLKDLDDADLGVLESIVTSSYRTVTRGVFTNPARRKGSDPAR
jgi:hypothetical protein